MGRENNGRPTTKITKNVKITKQRLREIRENNGYTQKEIANEYGVTTQTISQYEKCDEETNESPTIPIEYYLFISNKFNVSIDWIMGNDIKAKEKQSDKEKFDTYEEVIDCFRMLYNTFGKKILINHVILKIGKNELFFTKNHKITNDSVTWKLHSNSSSLMNGKSDVTVHNSISIDDWVINHFLDNFFKNIEYTEHIVLDDEFVKLQWDMFFEHHKKSLKDNKIYNEEEDPYKNINLWIITKIKQRQYFF